VLFFVCVLMRRELFDQAGLLDEDFGLGNGEDREFCGRVKARLAGRLLVDPGVFVHHEGHGTFRRLPAGMFGELLRRNEALAQSKAEKRAGGS
jgi:GT2 family glycosyltransferase